jgi:hypothetical protein
MATTTHLVCGFETLSKSIETPLERDSLSLSHERFKVRGPHGPPSGAESGRGRRGGCETGMGHGAPRLKQVRSWGLSSGRAGATAAMGADRKLAPHDHDQPAGALEAGAVRAASLNGGRNACAPTSTITPTPSVPRSRVQPAGHSLHRRRGMTSEIDQDHHRCTRHLHETTPARFYAARLRQPRSGCIFCIWASAAAPALVTFTALQRRQQQELRKRQQRQPWKQR